ncbi:DUF4190 domain-containing protein [Actinophytocola algeriensis]|uniref:DUF4190 domain-containing protein n=1 Tax=Actinophytocola algeriensis TaxID=1768010 RepID=A0A7W7Q8T4_9PSEU|nr:DUF4190 domain-containing protein [Actinophytocola algeriensis]MBB4908948.1 hypothetical protein [Actinophytocola algeriensis]MBE1474664.1 hypothetical protein [Actinophytocola algeriensis]
MHQLGEDTVTTPQDPEGQPYYAEPPVAGAPYPAQQQYQQPYQPQYPPAYPPPGYGQPPYPYPYPPTRSTNGMAIASMVLGIVWVYWIGSILALIFGYVALKEIRQSKQAGEGMAIAGIVLGWIGIGVLVIVLLLVATRGFS